MSVLFALVAAVGWGSSDFAAGHASRRSSAVSVVILTHFAAVVALVAVSLIPGQGGSPTLGDLGWGLAAGLGGGLGAMLLFRGLGKGSMAVVAPITATGAASIPVIAGVVQGDPITLFGVLGVLLALVAIVMVSLTSDDTESDTDGDTATREAAGPLAFAATEPHGWAAPSGGPISTTPPSALIFLQSIASPSTTSAPTSHASSTMPAPMQHRSLLAAPVPAVRTAPPAAVALLERPPAPPPPPPTPPPPMSPPMSPSPGPPPGPFAPPAVPTTSAPPSPTPSSPPPPARSPSPAAATVAGRFNSMARRPGVMDALLSGIGFGLFFVFIARTAESAGHWPLVSARGISVVMFVIGALLTRGAVLPEKGSRRAVVLAGVLDAAAALFFVLSTRDGLLSVGAVLASLYPAVTIVLARFISNERIVKRQLVGLALATMAVSLLAI